MTGNYTGNYTGTALNIPQRVLNESYTTENGSVRYESLLLDNITNTMTDKSYTTTTVSSVVMYEGPPERSPMPLLIASPVAAVSILIFVCVAYYCHAAQLDERARELAVKIASGELNVDIEVNMTNSATAVSMLSTSDSDKLLCTQKRRQTLLPVPVSPVDGVSKSPRGSVNWSALADQELVTHSAPRRHSTFII